MTNFPAYILLIALTFLGCKTQKETAAHQLKLSETHKIWLLDSAQSAQAIITDSIDFFFEKIKPLDMSIQLKRNLEEAEREVVLEQYKSALQREAMNFTPLETQFIEKVFRDIFDACNQLNAQLFPTEIKLIKVKGEHYGKSTYYTRQNCIIIPQTPLKDPDYELFTKVMLHELFHIFSRFQPDQREKLYEIIGFKSLGKPDFLQMNRALSQRVLLNPDGVNYAYGIQLLDQNKSPFLAIPLVLADTTEFLEEQPSFFDYLDFALYKIEPPFSKLIRVVAKNNGDSTIDLEDQPEFFTQIKDNTKYIIHPDEIMADNFVIAVQSLKNPEILDELSADGKILIDKILKLLSAKATNSN